MQPLTRSQKQKLLDENPDVTPEMIEEYELLLAKEFASPRSRATAESQLTEINLRDVRLIELGRLLFPNAEEK